MVQSTADRRITIDTEDHRASVGIDLEHDRANTDKLQMPPLALRGVVGFVGGAYDVLATWREVAEDVCGHGVPGGHFCPKKHRRKR